MSVLPTTCTSWIWREHVLIVRQYYYTTSSVFGSCGHHLVACIGPQSSHMQPSIFCWDSSWDFTWPQELWGTPTTNKIIMTSHASQAVPLLFQHCAAFLGQKKEVATNNTWSWDGCGVLKTHETMKIHPNRQLTISWVSPIFHKPINHHSFASSDHPSCTQLPHSTCGEMFLLGQLKCTPTNGHFCLLQVFMIQINP